MKSSKPFFKRPIGIITAVLIGALIIMMAQSDIYYSKLERDYPLLSSLEQLDGIIINYKDHFEHTYIEINTGVKRHIRPTENHDYSPSKFSDFIALSDRIIFENSADQIQLIRDNRSYYFKLAESN
jgi:hypothetical protein